MASKREAIEDAATAFTKKLTDEGKLIESGFAAFAYYVIPKEASPIQLREMRLAYMAGAEHVWSSILNILDPGDEPTEADMSRMDLIQRELDVWRGTLSERVDPSQGTA